jgi:hypothetical protein
MEHFEKPIIALLTELKICDNKKTKSALRKSIRRVFQYYTETLPRLVSVEAYEYNKQHNNLDLHSIQAFNKRRGKLVLEHTTPIMSFINHVLTLPEELWVKTIQEYSPCCWITKDEDKRLTKMGFNTKRNGGWKKCYDECEINLVMSI